jgi:hypothetical protein
MPSKSKPAAPAAKKPAKETASAKPSVAKPLVAEAPKPVANHKHEEQRAARCRRHCD